MKIKDFGKLNDGRSANLFVLTNANGMEASVTDFGATLVSVVLPDKNGKLRDVVLGHAKVSDYESGSGSIGATVGRFANRIGNASFEMNGRRYELTANNGPNALHGGRDHYDKRLWQWKENSNDESVTFVLDSPDGDQGFPGNLHIEVTYSLTDENVLGIQYNAVSDQDTPLNLTNHSYFNMNGDASGSVMEQICMINASAFTPNDSFSLPIGEIRSVEGTPMDFRVPKKLGLDIEMEDEQLRFGNGYDHNFVLDGEGTAATLYAEESGIKMTVSTDLPGVQLYTANYMNDPTGKNGAVYGNRSAACFETQFWPDAVNKENFPGGMIKAGEEFVSRTEFKFEVE